ncbi:hypothetical protein VB776_22790 [Arcicella sp. DC2W]|uniref:Uncharacterized protein n=1 Tax=Arcicella gelida TaxID=2984195 RepID=A0ABU5SBI1_9BACT|nr:hypothetical protein [Arcicella sp. DC2W]MEA5405784.1 hypothetical protein [Arcicella sp. DC2W]
MKSFTIALTLFTVITLSNSALAIGFPHNLLSGKKVERKEMKSKNIVPDIQKKTILNKESRLLSIGSKILLQAFKREE